MTENKVHFDEDLDLRISPKLSEDLNTLFEPQFSVPSELDRAIMDRANQCLAQRHWRHRVFRHISIWRIAAAAAVIIFAFSLNLTKKPGPTTSRSVLAEAQAVDIDRNGRVDILDAFKLARHIESADAEKKWDINGDGFVNRKDVDLVASAAVSLPLQGTPPGGNPKQGPG
jgi:hypothetical protein